VGVGVEAVLPVELRTRASWAASSARCQSPHIRYAVRRSLPMLAVANSVNSGSSRLRIQWAPLVSGGVTMSGTRKVAPTRNTSHF
jgi:ribosome biogenesis protein Tsr3